MNDLDRNVRRVLRRYEKKLETELIFDLDDLIDFANGRLEELIKFLKENKGEDIMGVFSTLVENNLSQGVDGITEEEVIKELKAILKAHRPICLGVPYDTEDEEADEFIELSSSKNQIYHLKGFNPFNDNYDLEEDGEEISYLQ